METELELETGTTTSGERESRDGNSFCGRSSGWSRLMIVSSFIMHHSSRPCVCKRLACKGTSGCSRAALGLVWDILFSVEAAEGVSYLADTRPDPINGTPSSLDLATFSTWTLTVVLVQTHLSISITLKRESTLTCCDVRYILTGGKGPTIYNEISLLQPGMEKLAACCCILQFPLC